MAGLANGLSGNRIDGLLPHMPGESPRHGLRSRNRLSVTNLPDLGRSRGVTSALPMTRSVPDIRDLPESPLPGPKDTFTVRDIPPESMALDHTCIDSTNKPTHGWRWLPHHLNQEGIWQRIREEAKTDAEEEPTLASVLHSTVLVHRSLHKTMAFILANKLSTPTLLGTHLMRLIQDAYEEEPDIIDACCADMQAVYDRDPACDKYSQCMLYFKGFQAVQSHRIANWLWKKGRKPLALAIQSRVAEVFDVDIHPGAEIGRGVMIDHATGVVIGETAVVKDNVSMLHQVTLGGSGTGIGKRHPTIGHGVLLGAGVSVLGPLIVGDATKVGAGTVVVESLPSHAVAVGVPARIVKRDKSCNPCTEMDQCSDFTLDFQI